MHRAGGIGSSNATTAFEKLKNKVGVPSICVQNLALLLCALRAVGSVPVPDSCSRRLSLSLIMRPRAVCGSWMPNMAYGSSNMTCFVHQQLDD